MGCNVTTLIDTLIVALLLDSPTGFTVVLIGMISIAIMSLLVLVAFFAHYESAITALVSWALVSRRNLAIVLATLFIVPLVLVFV